MDWPGPLDLLHLLHPHPQSDPEFDFQQNEVVSVLAKTAET